MCKLKIHRCSFAINRFVGVSVYPDVFRTSDPEFRSAFPGLDPDIFQYYAFRLTDYYAFCRVGDHYVFHCYVGDGHFGQTVEEHGASRSFAVDIGDMDIAECRSLFRYRDGWLFPGIFFIIGYFIGGFTSVEEIEKQGLVRDVDHLYVLEGATFKNSPSWCLHPLMCEDITLNDVKVFNPWYSQNGDALDLESCKNALVINCLFDAGDDAICIKSGKDKDGRERGIPCENVIVRNNIVLHGHGGFVVGSEMSGGVRNVYVADCTFLGTDVGLRFKSTRGRGGAHGSGIGIV